MLFPAQGQWTEEEYLALDTIHRVELADGCIEVHPAPTVAHQLIVAFLYRWLDDYVRRCKVGVVVPGPFPLRVALKTYRVPDLLYLKHGRLRGTNPCSVIGADLAIEVVSDGEENRRRDLETKPAEYAAAGISEYWIVDPEQETITVLVLDGTAYRQHGIFRMGDVASSVLLPGLALPVADAFAAAQVGE